MGVFKNGNLLSCSSISLKTVYINYSSKEKILYSKQHVFQKDNSTDHIIVDQICKSFKNDSYTPGVFIDLSKIFDTVDH